MEKILNANVASEAADMQPNVNAARLDSAFSSGHAALVLANITSARAILRAVLLATQAQEDGSIEFEDNRVRRWQPAIDVAATKLCVVRSALMETSGAPALDWVAPLALVEALGAALWHGWSAKQGDFLDADEAQAVIQATIDALDALLKDCDDEGVGQLRANHVAPLAH